MGPGLIPPAAAEAGPGGGSWQLPTPAGAKTCTGTRHGGTQGCAGSVGAAAWRQKLRCRARYFVFVGFCCLSVSRTESWLHRTCPSLVQNLPNSGCDDPGLWLLHPFTWFCIVTLSVTASTSVSLVLYEVTCWQQPLPCQTC